MPWIPAHPGRPRHCAAVLLLLAAAAAGCTSGGQRVERGIASWYGGEFHGRHTASGEVFDTHQLTAAHRTLAFGTLVEVRNLDNGRKVRVRINDRGPFVRGRVIDLSYAAAREIGMVGPGTARVEVVVLSLPPDGDDDERPARVAAAGPYTVQVGAFLDPARADALAGELAPMYPETGVSSDGTWFRVQVGSFGRRRDAEGLRRDLSRLGFTALVVRR